MPPISQTIEKQEALDTQEFELPIAPTLLPVRLIGENPKDSEVTFPEGGLQAWLVVLGGFCLSISTFGYIVSWGNFQAYYETTALPTSSASSIAWIGSLQASHPQRIDLASWSNSEQYSLIFLPGLFAGRLFDLGYFRLPLRVASVFFVASNFLIAECHQYWHFLLCQGFTLGLSSGCIYVPCVAAVSQWFKVRRPVAFSVVSLGVSVGGIMFPILFRNLVPQIGFAWTVRTIAFINLVSFCIANLTMRTRLPHSVNHTSWFNFRAFKSLPYTFYVFSTFFSFLGLYTMLTFLSVSAVQIGISPSLAFYLVAISNATSAIGRITGGVLAMKYGPINIMIFFTLVAAGMTYAWPFVTTHSGFIVLTCIYGASSGVFVGLFPVGAAQLGETHDIGLRAGMQMSVMAIGALGGPPISGAIAQGQGNFRGVGVYAGTMIIIAVLLMIFTRFTALQRFVGGKM